MHTSSSGRLCPARSRSVCGCGKPGLFISAVTLVPRPCDPPGLCSLGWFSVPVGPRGVCLLPRQLKTASSPQRAEAVCGSGGDSPDAVCPALRSPASLSPSHGIAVLGQLSRGSPTLSHSCFMWQVSACPRFEVAAANFSPALHGGRRRRSGYGSRVRAGAVWPGPAEPWSPVPRPQEPVSRAHSCQPRGLCWQSAHQTSLRESAQ